LRFMAPRAGLAVVLCLLISRGTVTGQCNGNATITSPIICNGGTATVTIIATGGTEPYSYTFNGNTNSTGIFSGIPAGINLPWSLTDANPSSCTINGTLTVTEPALLSPGSINTDLRRFCTGGTAVIGGSNPPYGPPMGGSGSYTYTWQIQTGCTGLWTDIPLSNTTSYTPQAPAATSCYRRKVTDNICLTEAYTGAKTIEIYPDLGSQTVIPAPSNNSVCAGTFISSTFTGGSGGFLGSFTDIYEYSTNSGVNWGPYISGQQISTTGLSGIDLIRIRTRRVPTGVDGCNYGLFVTASWTVSQLPATSPIYHR
jgi:hypothetical protein